MEKNPLKLIKENKRELQFIKIVVLLIVNTCLLIIFWKIFILEGINIGENNIVLKKTESILKPVLIYLGIDVLTPSTIKMLIISLLIIITNITVLHFNTVALVGVSLWMARYGYKMYTNYLINQENILKTSLKKEDILPEIPKVLETPSMIIENLPEIPKVLETPAVIIENLPEIPKVLETSPVIIQNVTESGTNWWLWGTVIAVGVIAIAGIVLAIWSHNTNVNNIVESTKASRDSIAALDVKLNNIVESSKVSGDSITALDYKLNAVNQKTIHINNKIDLIFNSNTQQIQSLKNMNELTSNKLVNLELNLEEAVVKMGKLEKTNLERCELMNTEILKLSTEAKSFFGVVSESTTTTEAIMLTISKFYEELNALCERVETTEVHLNSIIESSSTTDSTINTNLIKDIVNKDAE